MPIAAFVPGEKAELVGRDALKPPQPVGDVRRHDLRGLAGMITELVGRGTDGETLDRLDEAAPIGAAAKLAVGHDLEAELLLERHGVADRLVAHRLELVLHQLAGAKPAIGLGQRLGAQQAANMLGAETRGRR